MRAGLLFARDSGLSLQVVESDSKEAVQAVCNKVFTGSAGSVVSDIQELMRLLLGVVDFVMLVARLIRLHKLLQSMVFLPIAICFGWRKLLLLFLFWSGLIKPPL